MIAIALALWATLGNFVAPPIVATVFYGTPDGAFYGWASGDAPCFIGLWSKYWSPLDEHGQLYVIVHEVGHCLGLPHVNGESIMSTPVIPDRPLTFSPEDSAAFRVAYPLPVRGRVAMLSFE